MPNSRKYKILMTGGHAGSTAYAVTEEIKRQNKDWKLYFVGGKSSLEGRKTRVLPSVSLTNTNVEYFSIVTGRLQRKFTKWTIPSILKIPIGFLQSVYLLLKINPDVILSFGGYVAFPVVICAWILRKKIIIHEQTAAAGRANIFTARFADKVALSRESSRKFFPESKSVVTGNPISPKVTKLPKKNKLGKPPTILVTGGASGSKTINDNIDQILDKLLTKYILIHQTGDFQIDRFRSRRQSLSKKFKSRYAVKSIFPSSEWPKQLQKADLVVSRSGANIVAELMCIKLPSLLIPLPIAYLNEQNKNAQLAQDSGIAEILLQKDLDPEILLQTINKMIKNWHSYIEKAGDFSSPDINASTNLINEMERLL